MGRAKSIIKDKKLQLRRSRVNLARDSRRLDFEMMAIKEEQKELTKKRKAKQEEIYQHDKKIAAADDDIQKLEDLLSSLDDVNRILK